MGLSTKQYEALRKGAIAEARSHGVSAKQLENHVGELFEGEREYLIKMNPLGKKPPSTSTMVAIGTAIGFLMMLF